MVDCKDKLDLGDYGLIDKVTEFLGCQPYDYRNRKWKAQEMRRERDKDKKVPIKSFSKGTLTL